VLWDRNLTALSNEQIQAMSTGQTEAQALIKDEKTGMHPTVTEFKNGIFVHICPGIFFLPAEI